MLDFCSSHEQVCGLIVQSRIRVTSASERTSVSKKSVLLCIRFGKLKGVKMDLAGSEANVHVLRRLIHLNGAEPDRKLLAIIRRLSRIKKVDCGGPLRQPR